MNKNKLYNIAKKTPKPLRKLIKLFYNPIIPSIQKMGYGEKTMSKDEEKFFLSKLKEVENIEGDIIELGVYKGGTLLTIAKNTNKKVYGLDTFEGLPKESEHDKVQEYYKGSMNNNDFDKVKEVFKEYPNIKLFKGLIKDTLPNLKDKRFSFASIDLDLYEGTRQSLEFLIPRMNKGSIIVVDDYDSKNWMGVRKAVLEVVEEKNLVINEGKLYLTVNGGCKMKIIGFHNAKDAGAALLIDGKIKAVVNEERLNKIKLYSGFPKKSIEFLLKVANLKLKDIDYFIYGWFKGDNTSKILPKLSERIMLNAKDSESTHIIKKRLETEYLRDNDIKIKALKKMKEMGIPEEKIKFIEHHKSHAWSAFATSPFSEALVITSDGRGDYKSSTVSIANEKGIKEVDWLSTLDSLGYLYGQITGYLGFKPDRHEGKITGLAAYGDYKKTLNLMNKLITWKYNQIFANIGSWYKPFFINLSPKLINELNKYKKEDIAAGVQHQTEYLMVKFIKKQLKKYPYKNICLSGGIFANVKVNQKVLEIEGVENVYIHPHMGDGGLGLGSAIAYNFEITGQTKINMPTTYLGPKFTNDEILKELKKHDNLSFKKIENKPKLISKLIQKNKVIGYFNGKMEYGPRALGNRSILYHTKDKTINDWLNKRLMRTEFMPFAPVILEELANRCFINWDKKHICSHFMTITYNSTKEFKKNCPAVNHVDGTARPQIITKEENPDYYDILKQYYEDTGDLSLINTSFNQHEKPIVHSPKDAIDSLLDNCVDILIIEDYLVEVKK